MCLALPRNLMSSQQEAPIARDGDAFFWVTDQTKILKNFYVVWHPGAENLADYFTKHFCGKHHQHVRGWYLHTPASQQSLPRAAAPSALQGCVHSSSMVNPSTIWLFRHSADTGAITAIPQVSSALSSGYSYIRAYARHHLVRPCTTEHGSGVLTTIAS
jgi:hypothetical protein